WDLIWVRNNFSLVPGTGRVPQFIMALSEDITKRKQAEEALRKSEERWRSVFENSAIGVALTDLNGRFMAVNRAYQEIVGYTEEELRTLVASRQLLWRVRLPSPPFDRQGN